MKNANPIAPLGNTAQTQPKDKTMPRKNNTPTVETVTATVPTWNTTHDAAIAVLTELKTVSGKVLPTLAAHVLAVAKDPNTTEEALTATFPGWDGFGSYMTTVRLSALNTAAKSLLKLPINQRTQTNAEALVAHGAALGTAEIRDRGRALKAKAGVGRGRATGTPNAETAAESKPTPEPVAESKSPATASPVVTTKAITPADLSDDDVVRIMADLAVEAFRRQLAIPSTVAGMIGGLHVAAAVKA